MTELSERDEAIQKLLSLCDSNNVAIPDNVREALRSNDADQESMSAAPEQNDDPGGMAAALIQLVATIQSERSLTSDELELTREIRATREKVKMPTPTPYEVHLHNASYTIKTQVNDEDQEDVDPENQTIKSPKIKTVGTESPAGKVINTVRRIVKTRKLRVKTTTEEKVIMKGVYLKFEPGKMYLVLGAPGCGKSTLLKMVANLLLQDKDHVVGGSVSVNGIEASDENVVWTNLVSYTDQIDRLHPLLTVKETCEFAWKCRSGGTHAIDEVPLDDPEVKESITKMDAELYLVMVVLRGMGIARVKDTFVGNDSTVRGVSGGERKRVTVAEISCLGAPISCADEISTGLDAATTFDITQLMGEVTRMMNVVKIMSLLQPPPETVALFDELILIDKGLVLYSGPVTEVVPYFENLGYFIPSRVDPADWLQSLPTSDGAQYLSEKAEHGHFSGQEFADAFASSERGQILLDNTAAPFSDEMTMKGPVSPKFTHRYHNSWFGSFKLLLEREVLLWWRDKYQIKARLAQCVIMGLVAGTLFWQTSEPGSIMGILFQSGFFIALGAMQRVPPQLDVRPTFYKQQDANFYPTGTFVIARSIAGIPSSLIDALVYGTIVYWFVGLAFNDGASIANFFIFLLIVLIAAFSSGMMFGILSGACPDKSTAQASMSVALIIMVLFSGFTVQPDVIPDYWIWVYWSNLFAWVLRALVVNEYQSGKYDEPVSEGSSVTEGDAILNQFGMTLNGEPFGSEWSWYGIVFCIGISLVSIVVTIVLLSKIRFESGKSLGSNDTEEEEESVLEVALPFQQATMTFEDIRYSVKASTSDETLDLLKGIDGFVEAGKMTALMGSSGAGKTTLMDVLALRKTSGEITGEVRLNGHLQEPHTFRRIMGYVEQFDVQSPQLTIRETVEFSARLRLDENDEAITPESTQQFVEQTLRLLGLHNIEGFLVGSDSSGGLSFEQRKRLSIAVELAANPSILFLDEPTSGLDARAASVVMRGLKNIALSGRAVCATIHQPSLAIFTSFDALLLLKRGGETVFFGELGDESVNLIRYLEGYATTPKIQPGENPATWMLTTIGAGSGGTSGTHPFDYARAYSTSQLSQECHQKTKDLNARGNDTNKLNFNSKYATARSTQRLVVAKRMMKVYWRSPTYNVGRTMVSAIVALLFGSVYASQRVPENESDMNSRITSIYITFVFLGVNAFNTVIGVYEAERNMFYRHKASLMYSKGAIALATTIVEIPFILSSTMIFVVCFYFLIGFSPVAWQFFLFYLFFAMSMASWTFLGQMCMSLLKDSTTAQGFGGLLIAMTALFSGVLIRPQYISGFWTFAYWLFSGHYVLEGLLMSQYYQDDTPILPSQGSPFYDYVYNQTECQQQLVEPDPQPCYGTAEEYIYVSFGGLFTWDHVPYNFLYLLGLFVLTKSVTWYALQRFNYLAK